ncbi:alpha/beta fold hydrolase [Umezawaea sp. Da 62-37]|uniref:thioesterase II family protein n=1 Tax=Umezawaea sp. Da 62-37 TaxID=3075927 RepID=UPI0028F72D06|nr:alpha/beta fold hydrolase [Umezawaea sp. Da 62-37]WNV85521.1 alpha/beta fold hydrolase [Umezawaea sp. Da 62-37]
MNWFAHAPASGEVRLRLLCFPYAGGSATVFRGWEAAVPDGVEVLAARLPGRADRWREEPFTDLDLLVDALAEPVSRYVDEPFAFFGHSMGALISFELARRLRRDHGREPAYLFVASCNPPLADVPMPVLASLDDEGLRAKLADLGLADDVLAEEELMEVMLPLVRADLHIADGYVDRDGEPLSCPMTAFRGRRDPMVDEADMAQWARGTTGPFALRSVEGAHLFDDPGWRDVLTAVSDELDSALLRKEA